MFLHCNCNHCIVLFVLLFVLVSSPLSAVEGPIAWVQPDPQTRTLKLKSSFKDATLSVTDPRSGKDVNTPEKLYELGWIITPGGFLESRMDGFHELTPLHNMGMPLKITVNNLYPGKQAIAVQYACNPMVTNSAWSFDSVAVNKQKKSIMLTPASGKLVRGLGGNDQRSLYEVILPMKKKNQSFKQASVTIKKYIWAKQSRIHGIRIETTPSLTISLTKDDTPHNRLIHQRLAQLNLRRGGKRTSYSVCTLPSMVKVKPKSFASIRPEWMTRKATLAACKGERESFQIMLYSSEATIKNLKWSVGEIVGPNQKKTKGIEAMIAPVGFVKQLNNPYQVDRYGYLPDPLLTFMDSLTIQAGDVQTLWVSLKVSSDVKPGQYRGTINLTADGIQASTVPFELTVWDIELPQMPYIPVVVGMNKHYDFVMRYGINPSNIYKTYLNENLTTLKRWKKNGATKICLGYTMYGRFGVTKKSPLPNPELLEEWLNQIDIRYKRAIAAGLKKQCYIYMFDEATAHAHTSMRIISNAIRQRWPELQQITTAYYGKSFCAKDGINIDTWVPLLQHFRKTNLANIGKSFGRNVWWYTCTVLPSSFPRIILGSTGMETRMLMGLMPHAFQVTGFLYWGADWKTPKPITKGPYTDWLPPNPYGDGNLLYTTTGKKPIPSIRIENIKDGLEDYDLIATALIYNEALKKVGKKVELPITNILTSLRKVPNPYVTKVYDFCRDFEKLEKLRKDLATYILQARKIIGRNISMDEIRMQLKNAR